MQISIVGKVKDKNKKEHKLVITNNDLETLIVEKAKAIGIEGYEGRVWSHFDEQIVSVSIDN
jgi:hypothetical protein